MKTSQLIKLLQDFLNNCGDLEVAVEVDVYQSGTFYDLSLDTKITEKTGCADIGGQVTWQSLGPPNN